MSTETGLRIKKIREFRNFNQDYMADKLDISQNAYSKIENGTSKISTDRLEQVAKVLDVPVESLLGSDRNIFNIDNVCGYIENGHVENMQNGQGAMQQTIDLLKEEVQYLKDQNQSLIKLVEISSRK